MANPTSVRASGRFVSSGPYSAGMTRMAVRTPGKPNIPLSIWYPSRDPEKRRRDGIYDLSFARDARPARGRFPLVVISHGSGGSDTNHHDWAEHLARQGIIAAAPRHLGDSHDDQRGLGSDEQLVERPRQLKAALDAALAHPRLDGVVDSRRIGAMGFSAGGYTVLTLLGARPDYSRWRLYCQANPDPSVVCPLGGGTDPAGPGGVWEDMRDRRIRAAALFAPFALLFGPESLRTVTTPIRLYRAEDESVTRNHWNADAVAAGVSGPVETATVPGDHYVFIAPVGEAIRDKYPVFYKDGSGVDRPAIHKNIGEELAAYFLKNL